MRVRLNVTIAYDADNYEDAGATIDTLQNL